MFRHVEEQELAQVEGRSGPARSSAGPTLEPPSYIMFLQDPEGRFRWTTANISSITGTEREAVLGKDWEAAGIASDLTRALDALREEALHAGGRARSRLRSDLDRKWYDCYVEAVRGPGGRVDGTVGVLIDATERIDNERLRAIVGTTEDAVFIKDKEGRYMLANPAMAQIVKRRPTDIIGRTDMDILEHPEEAKKVMGSDRRVMVTGAAEVVEDTVLTSSGQRTYLVTKTPYLDSEGEVVGTIGIARDITNRKRMEDLLRASEELFHTLIENAPVAIAMSRGGLTTYANPRYLEMFGYSNIEELYGHPFTEQVAPADRDRALEFAMAFVMGRREVREMEIIGLRKDGSLFPFHVAITMVALRDGPVVLGFFSDITKRRRAEEEVQKARSRFEGLFSASNEGIALHENVYDPEGRVVDYRIIDVNPAYVSITGIPQESAVGQLASELYGTGEPPYLEIFTPVGETGTSATLETYFAPLGKHFMISIFSPAKGQFATVFFDITERRRMEREIEEARSRTELYIDLLTHDIANYNTAAMGYLQLAEAKLGTDATDRRLIQAPLQVLRDSSELIANVRDLKAVEAGRERSKPVDVCRVLQEVKELYQNPPNRKVAITIDEGDKCMVMASSLLRGVFSNIISNAIKHSQGDLVVKIAVDQTSWKGKEMARVAVEDNGPGIRDERKEMVFDRLSMGLTKPVSKGLGLYLVKRLVEGFGGATWIEDRVSGDSSQGARFVVLLPLATRQVGI